MGAKKRVLIPAFYFPPYGTVGVFRLAKFVEYLPKYGWEPHVITVSDGDYKITESVHEFPRTLTAVEQIDRLAVPCRKAISSILEHTPATEKVETKTLQAAWALYLTRRLTKDIREKDIDIVFASGGPFLPLISLPIVKRRTGTPYVIDLRDPWARRNDGMNLFDKNVLASIYDLTSRTLEPKVIKNASSAITVTEKMSDQYRSRYPQQREKIHTIHNGFDPADFQSIEPKHGDRFRIIYPGKWYGKEYAKMFLEGFAEFTREFDANLLHYGKMDPEVEDVITDLDIGEYVTVGGYVDRETVSAAVKGSNVGLVISRSPNALSTKVFDYIGCNVPILAICNNGSTLESVVDNFENGYTVPKGEPEEVCSVLKRLRKQKPETLGDVKQVSAYTLDSLTGELATILNEAANLR